MQSTLRPPRRVNIESAIDNSSYKLPVFVALVSEGGEEQVVKTFATAREVFDHVFGILVDRLLQRQAVETVENLVPESARLKGSRNTEYVMVVRGKAVFWFSAAAAKRAAGRRLLLEHARELAVAEQAPFYKLNTRARRIRAAAIALALIVCLMAVLWVGPLLLATLRAPKREAPAATLPVAVSGAFVDARANPNPAPANPAVRLVEQVDAEPAVVTPAIPELPLDARAGQPTMTNPPQVRHQPGRTVHTPAVAHPLSLSVASLRPSPVEGNAPLPAPRLRASVHTVVPDVTVAARSNLDQTPPRP